MKLLFQTEISTKTSEYYINYRFKVVVKIPKVRIYIFQVS